MIAAAILAAPVVLRFDGLPSVLAVGAYPLSSLLTEYGLGLGGYKIIVIYCIVCWAIGLLAGCQTVCLRWTMLDTATAGLFAISLVNIMVLSQAGKLGTMQDYAGDLIVYLFLRFTIFSKPRLWWVLYGFAIGAGLAALLGFWRYGTGLVPVEENLTRLSIPGQNINGFGSIMLMAVGISLALVVPERRLLIRLLLVAVVVMGSIALVLTFSRGAFVGAVAMIAAGLLLSRSFRFRLASLVVAAAALIGVWTGVAGAFGLSSYVSRVTAITTINYSTTAQRNVLWAMGWQQFTSHWLFGLGIGNFDLPQFWYPLAYQFSAPRGFFLFPQGVHNFYIGWASDAGVVGLVFLIGMLFLAVRSIVRATRRTSDPLLAAMGHAVMFAFVGYFVYVASSPEQGYQLPYITVALAGCLASVASGDTVGGLRSRA